MKFSFLILLLIPILSVNAQQRHGGQGQQSNPTGVIFGTVTESSNNNPIEFANVVIYSQRDSSIVSGGITDAEGKFKIDKIPNGKYYAEIQFIGFGKYTVDEISISRNNNIVNLDNIKMELSAEMLGEVQVEAQVDRVEYRLDRRIVNVSRDITAAGGTAVDALENVPAIQTDIDGNVSLRGTESFMVLIDGRPSPVQGSEALQQIPADAIESIEIITNPSARYEADGVGGIINVIMKKDRRLGYNAQVTANYGSFNAFGGDALVNIRRENINFFIGGNYNDRVNKGEGKEDRISFLDGDTSFNVNTVNDRQRNITSGSFRTGMDYYINDSDVITLSARYNTFTFGRSLNSTATSYFHDGNESFGYYNYFTDNDFATNWEYFSGDINYMKKFSKPGHELQVYASYAANFREDRNLFSEQEIDYLFAPIDSHVDSSRTIQDGTGSTIRAQVDYEYPFNENSKVEMGYQIRISDLNNDYKFQNRLGTEWIDDDSQNNPYLFSRNIQSGYLVFSDQRNKFGYMLGLRTEFTDREFNPELLDTSWVYPGEGQNKMDFFPSVHTSYKLPRDFEIMASYSRRLNRPRPWFLDPFPQVSDPNNMRQGNPMLEPEYTNSFEVNLQKRFNRNFVSVELYHRHTTNRIERYIKLHPDNPEIFVSTFENIGESLATGAEFMTNLNLARWWTFNLSGSVYHYEIVDVNSTVTWTSRLNNTFRIPDSGTSFQITGFYRGRTITSQGERLPMYMANLGVRQDLLDRTLTIGFNIQDIFNTMGHESITDTPALYTHLERNRIGPTFRLSVTYRINDFESRRERPVEDMGGMDNGM